MTIELLIQAIVRQTTILIAQLATAQGVRAPLAQIASQVFLELVRELDRQGVSRKVSADMFGLGLRTFRRKIQRLNESHTERGRSLWEVVLEYVQAEGLVSRRDILTRFASDEEEQVRGVLHDLCESELLFSSGTGKRASYRAATAEEFAALQHTRGEGGEDELLIALMYREGPLTLPEIATLAQRELDEVEAPVERLLAEGRLESVAREGITCYQAVALVIPLGAPVGWEAAVFDHYKALVTTVLGRLSQNKKTALADRVGGSTYTIDVWKGHPYEEEVLGALGRVRSSLGELRTRVHDYNLTVDIPETRTRTVMYVGQNMIEEGDAEDE